MRPREYRFRRLLSPLLGALLLLVGVTHDTDAIAAGPTVGALLEVCDRAFAQGYQGIDAATCEWFAAPCACKLRDRDGGDLPWCVPDSEPIDATVRKVVAALRLSPDPDAPSEPVVQVILTRLYPCYPREKR
jgi:hypothetical protein